MGDAQERVKWFGKAAEQGFRKAQFMLGFKHYHGVGVPVDHIKGVKMVTIGGRAGRRQGANLPGRPVGLGSGGAEGLQPS